MPELPEVEVCRRGLQPEVEGQRIRGAVVRTLPAGGRVADVLFTPDGRFVVAALRAGFVVRCV